MALNIVAHRRVSLKGFAEGWDDCFLTVKAVNQAQLEEIREQLTEGLSDEQGMKLLRQTSLNIIVGGTVINTKDDGSTEPVQLEKSDIPAVVDVLGAGWLQEVLSVATGADRLKVKS